MYKYLEEMTIKILIFQVCIYRSDNISQQFCSYVLQNLYMYIEPLDKYYHTCSYMEDENEFWIRY